MDFKSGQNIIFLSLLALMNMKLCLHACIWPQAMWDLPSNSKYSDMDNSTDAKADDELIPEKLLS